MGDDIRNLQSQLKCDYDLYESTFDTRLYFQRTRKSSFATHPSRRMERRVRKEQEAPLNQENGACPTTTHPQTLDHR